MNGLVADLTSQADGHSVYERSSFLPLKRHKKLQNIASTNCKAVINLLLTLSNSFIIFKKLKFI